MKEDRIRAYLKEFSKEVKYWYEVSKTPWNSIDEPRYTTLKKNHEYFKGLIKNVDSLKQEDITQTVEYLHSFRSLALAKARAINPDNNSVDDFKRMLDFISKPLTKSDKLNEIEERLKAVLHPKGKYKLFAWGIGAISEMIGNIFADNFVFFNYRNETAANHLGIEYETKGSSWKRFTSFQKSIQPLMKWYKEEIKYQTDLPFCIQIDQFFSWVYEKYVQGQSTISVNPKSTSTNNKITTRYDTKVLVDYLTKVHIENYYVLKNITLEKLDSNEIYILGENGVGKTLLLQAIIWCLKRYYIEEEKKEERETAFIPRLFNHIDYLKIIIEGQGGEDEAYTFFATQQNSEEINANRYLENIYAYGVNRGFVATNKTYSYDFMSLFDNNKEFSLQNPVEWLKSIYIKEKLDDNSLGKLKLTDAIEFVTFLFENKIQLDVNHNEVLFIEQDTNKRLQFSQLSEGYKSIFTWLIDLIARMSKNQPNTDIRQLKGIVLIDELDLFLHPKWAYDVVGKLRNWLPNVQFIITTHNPILTLGASEDAVFYKLYKEDGETKISEPMDDVQNLTANNLITSPIWGLETYAMHNVSVDEINENDFITKYIRKAILKKIGEKPLVGKELMTVIEKELATIQ